MHCCFGPQGDILSANPAVQVAPAIGLDVYLGLAMCIGKWFVICEYCTFMLVEVLPPLHT